jgi:MerR family transcriptional regulator, redox-sensitive transcriptional activator SoxR
MLATIGQAAKRCGVQPSALRYYESVGLLPNLPRSSGRRLYDAAALQRLAVIQLAKRAGFSISEIRTLVRGPHGSSPSERWRDLARRKLDDINLMVEQANEMRRILLRGMKCRCTTLDECVFCAFGQNRSARSARRNKSDETETVAPSEFLRRRLPRR